MLIFRYLAKEVFITLVALTSILMLIFMSNQVVIYLNRAASGIIPGMLVMKLMMLELPNLLSLLLPLGFYFALLLAYGRLYADSEMVVLQACGWGTGHLVRCSLLMALIVALITGAMILIAPSIYYQRAKLLNTTGVKTLIQTIVPGHFRVLGNGHDAFYVESMNNAHTQAKHIFLVRSTETAGQKAWQVLWANRAQVDADKVTGEATLAFLDGKYYQGTPGQADYQVATFERYQAHLPSPEVSVKHDIRTEPLRALWPLNNVDRKKAAELQWRISIPLMAFPLALVGIPLSRVNPRAGKYAKLLPAVVLCVVYANFMFISRDWIAAGKVPPWIGMWWLHGAVMILGLLLIWRNKRVLS